jgi:type IV secretory pathway TrbL component
MDYTTVAPAAVIKVVLAIAGECIKYADDDKKKLIPEFSRILKGLICAFFAMLTGVFALLEYLVCFLEFMLVASVGVILFPLSLWEGSKFMAEKFVGAILGFFIKLLFCNIAIFLMLYGFVSLFYIISANGFTGGPDHIIFIIFTCLLFFFICKSIPGIAQSLLTGTPSLSAAGAIGAVGGMVAAAGATMHMAKNMGNAGKAIGGAVAGGTAKTAFAAHGLMSQASAAAGAVRSAGGGIADQAGAFGSSVLSTGRDAFSAGKLGLTRSLLGGGDSGTNPHSWRDYFNKTVNSSGEQMSSNAYYNDRKSEGWNVGQEYLKKHGGNKKQLTENPYIKKDANAGSA